MNDCTSFHMPFHNTIRFMLSTVHLTPGCPLAGEPWKYRIKLARTLPTAGITRCLVGDDSFLSPSPSGSCRTFNPFLLASFSLFLLRFLACLESAETSRISSPSCVRRYFSSSCGGTFNFSVDLVSKCSMICFWNLSSRCSLIRCSSVGSWSPGFAG